MFFLIGMGWQTSTELSTQIHAFETHLRMAPSALTIRISSFSTIFDYAVKSYPLVVLRAMLFDRLA